MKNDITGATELKEVKKVENIDYCSYCGIKTSFGSLYVINDNFVCGDCKDEKEEACKCSIGITCSYCLHVRRKIEDIEQKYSENEIKILKSKVIVYREENEKLKKEYERIVLKLEDEISYYEKNRIDDENHIEKKRQEIIALTVKNKQFELKFEELRMKILKEFINYEV